MTKKGKAAVSNAKQEPFAKEAMYLSMQKKG